MTRIWQWATGAALIAMTSGATLAWWTKRAAPLEGRYVSEGEVLQADGAQVSQYHSILFTAGRFYALTRIGGVQVETSGSVAPLHDDHYRLYVETGNITGEPAVMDDALRFNLLYGRRSGSVLNVLPVHGCLLSSETQQLYCKPADSSISSR
jgi:hypothetical protein